MKIELLLLTNQHGDHFTVSCTDTNAEEVQTVINSLHALITRGLHRMEPNKDVGWTEIGLYIDRCTPEVMTRNDFDTGKKDSKGYFRTSLMPTDDQAPGGK